LFDDPDLLRELYCALEGVTLPDDVPLLELEVKVLNINEGRNEEVVRRCKKLSEYSIFIAKIHAFWKELGSLEEGVKKAIKYCSKHGILKQFLEMYGAQKCTAKPCG